MAASSYPGSVRERIAQGNPPAVQPATAPRARGAAPGPVGGEQPGVQAPPLLPATHPMRERWEPNAPESGHYRRFRNLVESRVYGDDYDIEGAKRRLSKSRISDREEVMRARGPGFLSEAGRVLGQGVEGLIHGPFSTARDIAYEVDQAQGEFRRNLLGADEATGLGGGVVFDRDPDTNPNVWKPRVRRLSGDEYYGKDGRGGVPTLAEALIPLPDRPETLPGTLAGGVAQFLGLFTLLGQPQAMKKLGGVVYEIGKRVGERAIKSGRAASGVIRASGADAVAFDPGDPFVGDAVNALVKTYPQLEGPVSDLIKDFTFSTDPDDSRIKKRFMRSVEGFQLGVTAGSLFLVLKGFCAIPREGIRWLHKRTLLGKLGDAYDPKAKATPADTVRHKEIDKLEAERAADDVEPEPGAAPEEPMVPEAEGTPLDQMEARLRAAKDRDPRAARREGRARTIQAIMDKFGVSQLEAEDWYRSKLQERMLPKLMAREADATAEDLSGEIDQWEKNFGDTLDELRYGDEPELRKVPRHPILAEMERQGGVATVRQNESGAWVPTTLASELKKNFGVTPQTHPGLFRNPRRRLKWSASKRAETTPPKGDMDGFDWTDSPLVRGPKDSYGRPVDNNDLYEGISDELAGSPRYTDEQTDLVLERGIARDELRAELDELGIDLETTSNREAVEALHRKHAEAMGPEYPRVEEPPTPRAAEGEPLIKRDSGKIYRGQPVGTEMQNVESANVADNILVGRGVFLTTEPTIARTYGEQLFELPKPKEGILDLGDITPEQFRSLGISDKTQRIYRLPSKTAKDIAEKEDMIMEALAEKHLPEDISWNEVVSGTTVVKGTGPDVDTVRNQVIENLLDRGFAWVKHSGGVRTGQKPHDVYISLTNEGVAKAKKITPPTPRAAKESGRLAPQEEIDRIQDEISHTGQGALGREATPEELVEELNRRGIKGSTDSVFDDLGAELGGVSHVADALIPRVAKEFAKSLEDGDRALDDLMNRLSISQAEGFETFGGNPAGYQNVFDSVTDPGAVRFKRELRERILSRLDEEGLGAAPTPRAVEAAEGRRVYRFDDGTEITISGRSHLEMIEVPEGLRRQGAATRHIREVEEDIGHRIETGTAGSDEGLALMNRLGIRDVAAPPPSAATSTPRAEAPTPRAADEAAPRPGPHPARPPLTQSPGRLEDRASWELTRPEEGELHGVPASLIRALEIEKGGDELASGSPKNTPEQVEQLKLAGFLDKAGELTEKGAETLAGRIERFAKFQKAARNGEAVDRGAARDWPLQIARAYRYKRTMKPRGKKKAPGKDPADDLSVDEAKSVSEDILNERRIWDEERGKELMDKVYELTDRRLKHEVNQRANEAVLELFKAGRVTRDRSRPLFEQMAELIASRRVAPESIRQIMVKHNTDWTDFAAIWGTDVSASARQLGALGNLQRAINRGMLSSKDRMQLEAKLADEGVSTAERAEIQKTLDKAGGVLDEKMIEELRGLGIDTDMVKAISTWRRLENIRRGSMVSQISTAMRNGMTQGGNLSVSLMQELFEKSIRSTVNQYGKAKNLIGLDGTAALAHAELIHPIRAMETLLNITGRIRMGADGRWTREQGELGARVWKRDADAGWAPQGPDFSEFDWRHPLRSSKSWQSEGTDFVDHLLSVFPKHRDMLTSSFNADIAEAGIGSGAMAKAEGLVHALNTFNRFQEHVFRRAAFKAELGRQIEMNPVRISWLSKDERLAMKALRDDAEAWGGVAREEQERITQELLDDGVVYRSLDKLEADGLLGMIAKKQMDNAVNHSLDITWAKQFDPKTEKFVKGVKQRHHLYDSFAGHVVQGVNRFPMFSWVTPFPRFMANSIQWQLNHSPYGLTNAILSQRGRDLMRKGDYSELAEGLTGMTMLYASWELAGSEYATDKGTELRVPDALAETMGLEPGSTIDLRVYNPFLSYYWTGHTLRRHFEGKPPPSYTEIAQVFAGANVRAGLGLYVVDQLIDDLASVGRSTGGVGALAETGAIGGTLFGNLVASYATPLNMLWDGYKSFQQWRGNMEPSKVRDASGLAQSGETGPMPLGYEEPWYEAGPSNFWHAALGQVERRTPFASREVGSYFDRKTGEMAPVRAYPEVELATRSGAPVSYAPGWKLLTGMTFKDPKNMLGKELDRHGFRKDHIVPSSGNKLFDRQVARHFGDLVEFYGLPTFLASETYQRLSDPRKVQMLRDRLLRVREEAVRQAGNENTDLRDLVKRENAPYYKEMFIDGGGWRSEAETGSSGHLDFNQE